MSVTYEAPNTSGYCAIEYSPNSRASCKNCGRSIGEGDIRVANKTQSIWHDGFDTGWVHLKCVYGISRITQFKGWETLTYNDQTKVRKLSSRGDDVDPNAESEVQLKKESDYLMRLINKLDEKKIKKKQFEELWKANGMNPEGVRIDKLTHFVADSLLYGVLDPCPGCKKNSLTYRSGFILCEGWMSGFSECIYRGKKEDHKRYQFEIPPNFMPLFSNWLDEWYILQGLEPYERDWSAAAAAGAAAVEDYGGIDPASLKMDELRAELKKRGISTAGKKSAMVGRLKRALKAGKKVETTENGGEEKKAEEASPPSDGIDPKSLSEEELKTELDNRNVKAEGLNKEESLQKFLEALKKVTKATQFAETSQINQLTVAKLKTEVKNRGLVADKKAKKPDLVELVQRDEEFRKFLRKADAPPPSETKMEVDTEKEEKKKGGKKRKEPEPEEEEEKETPSEKKAKMDQVKRRTLPPRPVDTTEKKEAVVEKLAPAVKGSEILTVDPDFPKKTDQCQVVASDDLVEVYNATLNQIDLKTNHNKFYRLQLVDSGAKGNNRFYLYTKWGRTGVTKYFSLVAMGYDDPANSQLKNFGSRDNAIKAFEEKFKKMTGNKWEDRLTFVKKPKLYNFVELSRVPVEDEKDKPSKRQFVDAKTGQAITLKPCTLEPRLKDLVSLIFDAKKMQETMSEMGLNLKEMPLGQLAKSTIMKGYEVLKELELLLNEKNSEQKEGKFNELIWKSKVTEASTRFYSIIPSTRPVIIETDVLFRQRVEMMECLLELELANSLLKKQVEDDRDPTDKNYESLNAKLKPLDKDSEEFKMIQTYITNTHAETHRSYALELLDVFDVSRGNEEQNYKGWEKDVNRQLLWHGSRITNWVGILSQGLRIAPPEAPCTGYMFGKGVYFANMVSKSANYCFTSSSSPTGILLLSEVALGKMYELTHSEYMEKPPKGTLSTKGCGSTYPDPKDNVTLKNGCVVPLGKPGKKARQGSLLYDEFIVYDATQIKMKYLLKVNFKWGH